MPRQPLPKKHQNTDADMRPLAFGKRPEHAEIIGRCLTMWSATEVQMAILLSIVLRAEESDAAVAVYMVLRRSAPRLEAITVAGKITLSERDYELLGAVLHVYQTAEAERNALAHGCFGMHPGLPDSALWVEPVKFAHHILEALRSEDLRKLPPTETSMGLAKQLRHYTKKDLEAIHVQIREVRRMVFNLNVYLRRVLSSTVNDQLRDDLYAKECSSAPIQEALRDLRLRASKSRKTVPLQQRARRRRLKGLSYKGAGPN